MAQEKVWEREYLSKKLVTNYDKPQAFFLKFLKQLKKEGIKPEGLRVLDLGCGTGRNSNYLAKKGASAVGIEISSTAIKLAEERAKEMRVDAQYIKQSIGEKYPPEDNSFDLVIDITASNSLNEKERGVYLSETKRVLKDGGIFYVRALCKDGDKNAKNLLKTNPGKEKDTYIMPDTNITERVFSKEDFVDLYSKYFEILKIEKTESYSCINNRSFKRKFFLVTMKK